MKKIALVLLAVLMLFALASCGNKPEEKAASTLETPLIDLVNNVVPGTADMANLPLMDLEDIIGIEASQFTEAVYLQSTALEGGEAVVVRAVEGEAESVAAMLDNYLQRRKEETQNYVPEAYKLLSETSVQRKNNTVALIVTEKAAEVTTKLLAGE